MPYDMESTQWNVTIASATISSVVNITFGNTTDPVKTSISVARMINLCCRPIWIIMGTVGMYTQLFFSCSVFAIIVQ